MSILDILTDWRFGGRVGEANTLVGWLLCEHDKMAETTSFIDGL